MGLILSLETATSACSAALHRQGNLLAYAEVTGEKSHSQRLTLLIEQLLDNAGLTFSQLDAIAVSKGPGSYTGLRIGVSVAKGLCLALDKPLIGINTLEALALQVTACHADTSHSLFCPMLDARRMEVYTAVFDNHLQSVMPTTALILDESSFAEFLEKQPVFFFGNGAGKLKNLLSHQKQAFFLEDLHPSARQTGTLASRQFEKQQFEDTAYFEPYYLKEFMGTLSKKII